MEIFGVGSGEVIAIVLIMLVVAGPKRMVQWAYILGQYVAKFRDIWSQVMDGVQKELDEAGLDVQLPKTMPTKINPINLANPMNNVWANFTAPVQDVMNDFKGEIQQTQSELHEAVVVPEEKIAS